MNRNEPDPRPVRFEVREQAAPVDHLAQNETLWEGVLRETVAMCSEDEPLSTEEREAFREVARRHAGQAFSLDPVLVDLVGTVLRTQFNDRIRSMAGWPRMIELVATSLFEDPTMNRRLSAFWTQIVEAEDRERT